MTTAMTNTSTCTYEGDRDGTIVEYLYGEIDGATRAAFETHLAGCGVCRDAVDALGGVRQAIAQWAPPEPMRALDDTRHRAAARCGPSRAVGVGPADATSRFGRRRPRPSCASASGPARPTFASATDRTGRRSGPDGSSRSRQQAPASPAESSSSGTAPWRAELTALEQQLRADMGRALAEPVAAGRPRAEAGNDVLLRQIRLLISRSEQRQQRELALRIGDLLNEVQAQRRADLLKIDRSIGLVQNSTGMEVLRQREMLNSLAVRVSQRP